MINSGAILVHLDMDWTQVRMITVLMPSKQEATTRLNPVEPVELIPGLSTKFEPDLDSCIGGRIRIISKESTGIGFCVHSVRSGLTWASNPELDSAEICVRLKSILDPLVELSGLDISPPSEKDDHVQAGMTLRSSSEPERRETSS